ncbi:MAG TPA: gamma carbonic anhydrase family protein [Verrucomicrobiales bacterium]|nr:gamma carbonic anhydrase family protein [Verrucomicrobiales bacterium]
MTSPQQQLTLLSGIGKMPEFLARAPSIADSAFVAPSADLVGDVTVGEEASIWYQAVLRGDIQRIVIGPRSNIQDGCVVHLAEDQGTFVGEWVTCGHRAILHACTVEDEVLIGMGATVMDGTVVGARSIVGAGALVTMGSRIPPGSLVLGSPAKVVRNLDLEEQQSLRGWAERYVSVSRHFLRLAAEGRL